jgi:hypothetical protein
MLSRIGGRLVTSPVAFFFAGAIDISWLLTIYLRWRVAQRRERRAAGAGDGTATSAEGGTAAGGF